MFIGNNVVSFKKDHLFFFKGNLVKSIEAHKGGSQKGKLPKVSIFSFDYEQVSRAVLKVPEAYSVNKLLAYCNHGVCLSRQMDGTVKDKLMTMRLATGFDLVLKLYRLLDEVAENRDLTLLSTGEAVKGGYLQDRPKLQRIYGYIRQNYREAITLEEIASIANMSPTGFCRFFKTYAKKTFSQYLTEVRIENACRLLRDREYGIADCCYDSGFNNISNFNRHFKKITGMSPSEYRLKTAGSPSSIPTQD